MNRAGVNLARQAIASFRTQTRQQGPYFVLGSIGPTFSGRESPREIKEVYREQIQALISEGVDALLLETFSFLPHLMALLDLVGEFPKHPPLIIQMALHQTGEGWDQDPLVFAKTAADMGAQVIGANCCSPWEATAFADPWHCPGCGQLNPGNDEMREHARDVQQAAGRRRGAAWGPTPRATSAAPAPRRRSWSRA